MSNSAVVNMTQISEYAFMDLPGGGNAADRVVAVVRGLPDVDRIVFLETEGHDAGTSAAGAETGGSGIDINHIRKAAWGAPQLIEAFIEAGEGSENLFYVYGDCALLDPDLCGKMYDNHVRYWSQYSFADGYPYGVSPEIVRTEILGRLRELSDKVDGPLKRTTLFSIVQEDINNFDVDTYVSDTDQRYLRVSLTGDTKRNYLQLRNVMEAGGTDTESVVRVLDERQDVLRTLPAFVNVQIVDGCLQECSYCPFPRFGGAITEQRNTMSVENFVSIVRSVKTLCDDAVIGVSLWGEPSLHPEITALAREVASHERLRLLIETSGLGWDERILRSIRDEAGDRVTWIVSLDADNEDLYRRLRGNGFDTAVAAARTLLKLFPETAYVQAVRMKRSEAMLESFYRRWHEETDNVIIQKYDHYCGFLDEQKVTDLSPVNRFPCWHLKRDMAVRFDGTVTVCGEDVERRNVLGNVFSEPLEEIWRRGAAWYHDHIAGEYPDMCMRCDEYYTYNF